MSLARTGVASTLCFSPRQSFGRLLLCLRALKTRGAIAGGLQHVPVLSAPLPAPQVRADTAVALYLCGA